jgi:hypothetical protein
VGSVGNINVFHAFRWTAAEGMRDLGLLTGTTFSGAGAISADGSAVAGGCDKGAFLWTPRLGMVKLNEYLPTIGLEPAEFLWSVACISGDGLAMAGSGTCDYLLNVNSWIITGLPANLLACYANCDGSTTSPVLNVNDFVCFLDRFASGDSRANCDGSTVAPVLSAADFVCFLQAFAEGCP